MGRSFLALLVLLCSVVILRAHMPPFTTDDDLVARSDAIVVGHVEAGFSVHDTIPKAYSAVGIHVIDYGAVLVVTQVMKGNLPLGPTRIIIHGSLKPVVLDAKKPLELTMGEMCPPANETTGPQVPVGLFYPSTVIGMAPTADVHKDHIWFLRKASLNPDNVTEEDTSLPGVRWQQDVQQLDHEAYYRAIISGDPEKLAPFTQGDSWQATQARTCQDRLRVQLLDKVSDPELRADALVAFLQEHAPFGSATQLAMSKLTGLGALGLKKLVPIFQNAGHDYDRRDILHVWSFGNYQPAEVVISAWLRSEGQWWSRQGAQSMTWSFQVGQKGGPEYNDPHAVSNRNVYCAVEALSAFGGADAKSAIAETRAQWAALGVRAPPGNDIVAMCDQALSELR